MVIIVTRRNIVCITSNCLVYVPLQLCLLDQQWLLRILPPGGEIVKMVYDKAHPALLDMLDYKISFFAATAMTDNLVLKNM